MPAGLAGSSPLATPEAEAPQQGPWSKGIALMEMTSKANLASHHNLGNDLRQPRGYLRHSSSKKWYKDPTETKPRCSMDRTRTELVPSWMCAQFEPPLWVGTFCLGRVPKELVSASIAHLSEHYLRMKTSKSHGKMDNPKERKPWESKSLRGDLSPVPQTWLVTRSSCHSGCIFEEYCTVSKALQ